MQVDATTPVADGVLDVSDFIKYLQSRIKVRKGTVKGKAGNLGTSVTVEADKKNTSVLVVKAEAVELSKRYIKYLTKKYLRKQKLRDYIRTISSKDGYSLKYFVVGGKEEEEEEEEDDE